MLTLVFVCSLTVVGWSMSHLTPSPSGQDDYTATPPPDKVIIFSPEKANNSCRFILREAIY